ncbi:MAG: hypothetical protein ACXVB1_00075 [Pseudobdellovibrionaceae bacterium]
MRLTSTRPMDGQSSSKMKSFIKSKIKESRSKLKSKVLLSPDDYKKRSSVMTAQEKLFRDLFDETAEVFEVANGPTRAVRRES